MLNAVSRGANLAAEWVMASLLAAMTLLVGAQIAGRFLFGYSIFWSDEAARFLLVWIAFLGMSAGARRGAHPGVDSLVRGLSPHRARAIRLASGACCLLFFLVMVGYGMLLVMRTWAQHSPSLGLSMGIPYLAVPVAGLLMGLHTAAAARQGSSVRGRAGGPRG